MKKYRLIGLTGTTGAGKSTAAEVFRERGFCVISADSLAREIMDDEVVLRGIRSAFGDDVACAGALNRALLAERAFASREKTELLNRLTHPYITELLLKRIDENLSKGKTDFLLDAPQLFESRLNLLCDFTVAVTADEDERIKRIKERDGLSDDGAASRISAQYDDSFFKENCDYIIENTSSTESLRNKTEALISSL